MFDVFLYGAFPYLAFALAIGGGLYRYYRDRFQLLQLLISAVG